MPAKIVSRNIPYLERFFMVLILLEIINIVKVPEYFASLATFLKTYVLKKNINQGYFTVSLISQAITVYKKNIYYTIFY